MEYLSLPAPAKLNLFLNITGCREDGYHELQTYFQLIDLADTLRFEPHSDIQLTCSDPALQTESNLVLKAAQALRERYQITKGVHIHLEKHIPAGAGLGGGSSDAATALRGLNAFWQLNVDVDTLADLGMQLGADVPVFVRGESAWAQGIGEQLYPMAYEDRCYLVVVPPCHISTKEIFCDPGLTRDSTKLKIRTFPEDMSNDCESVVCRHYPEVDKTLEWLASYGQARLTGTGSACFVAFVSESDAMNAKAKVPAKWQAFVCNSLKRSQDHTDWGVAKW